MAKRAKKKRSGVIRNAHGLRDAYVLKGLQYAEQVVRGEVAVCKWVRLACERQLRDLERARTDKAWGFHFDEELAARACEFLEQLPHTQGPLSFVRDDDTWNTLVLEPWQCFIVTTVYGWIRNDSPPDRPTRRFTRVYEEVPRGNGKSFQLSGALLYSFSEGEQGVEAYSAAVDREQAMKVYGEAGAMLAKAPDLRDALGLEESAHAIFQKATNSKAIPLSREAKKTGDGKNVYFAAVDELHAHQTRAVWDVLDTGTGKRARAGTGGSNALIWVITTAGFNTAGVCYEKRTYATKILEGSVVDETWFCIIYTIDESDSWEDEECRGACADHSHPGCVWRKANPNWGVSVDPVDFESKARRAIAVASEQNNFLTKHLDVWCSADIAWMDMAAWDKCSDPTLREFDFVGTPCVAGLDLASKVDLACRAKVFFKDLPPPPEDPDEKPVRHFYLFVRSFLPEHAVRESKNSQYAGWAREGWIQTTPGPTLDFEIIKLTLRDDRDRYKVKEIAFDPFQGTQLEGEMLAEGLQMVAVGAQVKNFSEPMKEWQKLVLEGRFHHDGNPTMRWMVSNVVAHTDVKDNIYPRKQVPENKIDGAVATIMALNRALLAPAAKPSGSYLTSQPLVILG
jgi:phage terminase large subunit-like protein